MIQPLSCVNYWERGVPRVIHFEIHADDPECIVNKLAIRGIGWAAYCNDTEGNMFGLLEADAKAK